jgi:hypothetical protein
MRELSGKAAFVTAQTGMKVMIADIEEAALAGAVKTLKALDRTCGA